MPEHGFTPTESSHGKTTHDDLPMPGGYTFGELRDAVEILEAMGVPGVSHENGRQANGDAYAKYLEGIRAENGQTGIDQLMQQHAGHVEPKQEEPEEPEEEVSGAQITPYSTPKPRKPKPKTKSKPARRRK